MPKIIHHALKISPAICMGTANSRYRCPTDVNHAQPGQHAPGGQPETIELSAKGTQVERDQNQALNDDNSIRGVVPNGLPENSLPTRGLAIQIEIAKWHSGLCCHTEAWGRRDLGSCSKMGVGKTPVQSRKPRTGPFGRLLGATEMRMS